MEIDMEISDVSVVVGVAIMNDGAIGLILDATGIISIARQCLNIAAQQVCHIRG